MNAVTKETRRVTYEEFVAELKAQGVPRDHVAVKCFMCDTIQSFASFALAGVPEESAEKRFAFSCIGRARRMLSPDVAKGLNEGCDWSLGGLFSFSDYVIVRDGKDLPTFPPATPDEARALMAENTKGVAG